MNSNELENRLTLYTSPKGMKELRRISQKLPNTPETDVHLKLFYNRAGLNSGKFDLDNILNISHFEPFVGGCTLKVVSLEIPAYNFQDHLTSLASQGDTDTISVNYVYHNESLKLIRFTYHSAFDKKYTNDELFISSLDDAKAFVGYSHDVGVTLDDEQDDINLGQITSKVKTLWDYKYFSLVSLVSYIGPDGKRLSQSSNGFMWLRKDTYQPIEFLDLSEDEISEVKEFPFESSYKYSLDLLSKFSLDECDFESVLRPALSLKPSLRLVFTKRNYKFFKDFCRLEKSAFFVINCRSLPYSDPEFIVFETTKDEFLSYLQGVVKVKQGDNFVVQGDIALNWWFFNYFKNGQLRVDYFTYGQVRKLFSGPISYVMGSLLD